MVPYSHYQQPPPLLPPGSAGYPSTPGSYSYPYSNGVASTTQPASNSISSQVPAQILPLPGKIKLRHLIIIYSHDFLAMTSHTVTPHGYVSGAAQSQQNAVHDPTGQTCPPGAKPRVTATLWEDEGSLCYQVEAKGVCVARREGELLHFWDDRASLISFR